MSQNETICPIWPLMNEIYEALFTEQVCDSCGSVIPADEHHHHCTQCGVILCNYCFSASVRCMSCDAEPQEIDWEQWETWENEDHE